MELYHIPARIIILYLKRIRYIRWTWHKLLIDFNNLLLKLKGFLHARLNYINYNTLNMRHKLN